MSNPIFISICKVKEQEAQSDTSYSIWSEERIWSPSQKKIGVSSVQPSSVFFLFNEVTKRFVVCRLNESFLTSDSNKRPVVWRHERPILEEKNEMAH